MTDNQTQIEKWKQNVRAGGRLAALFYGWFPICFALLPIGFFIGLTYFKKGMGGILYLSQEGISFGLIAGVFFAAVVFIILGNRSKNVTDPRTSRRLVFFLVLAGALLVLNIYNFSLATAKQASASVVGVALEIMLMVYFFRALLSWRRLMKQEAFRVVLVVPRYRLYQKRWLMLGAPFGLLLIAGLLTDIHLKGRGAEKFTSAEAAFSILFPLPPKHQTKTSYSPEGEERIIHSFLSSAGRKDYNVTATVLPPGEGWDREAGYELMKRGLGNQPGHRLLSLRETDFEGNPAADFLIRAADGSYLRGKGIITENANYILMVGYAGRDLKEEEYQHFIDSFAIE